MRQLIVILALAMGLAACSCKEQVQAERDAAAAYVAKDAEAWELVGPDWLRRVKADRSLPAGEKKAAELLSQSIEARIKRGRKLWPLTPGSKGK